MLSKAPGTAARALMLTIAGPGVAGGILVLAFGVRRITLQGDGDHVQRGRGRRGKAGIGTLAASAHQHCSTAPAAGARWCIRGGRPHLWDLLDVLWLLAAHGVVADVDPLWRWRWGQRSDEVCQPSPMAADTMAWSNNGIRHPLLSTPSAPYLGRGPLDALDHGAGGVQRAALQLARGLDGVEEHGVALLGLGSQHLHR